MYNQAYANNYNLSIGRRQNSVLSLIKESIAVQIRFEKVARRLNQNHTLHVINQPSGFRRFSTDSFLYTHLVVAI